MHFAVTKNNVVCPEPFDGGCFYLCKESFDDVGNKKQVCARLKPDSCPMKLSFREEPVRRSSLRHDKPLLLLGQWNIFFFKPGSQMACLHLSASFTPGSHRVHTGFTPGSHRVNKQLITCDGFWDFTAT